MVNTQEYGWLSGVVYGRDPKNQLHHDTLT